MTLSTVTWLTGCQSKTVSPLSGVPVTSDKLETEARVVVADLESQLAIAESTFLTHKEALIAKAETLQIEFDAGFADIERQDATKAKFVEMTSGIVTSLIEGSFNPTQLLASLVGVGGVLGAVGVGLDNRKKDKVIVSLKNGKKPA